MKLRFVSALFSMLSIWGCSESESQEEEETVAEVKYIYFLDEEATVTREEGRPFTTTVSYVGGSFEGAIRVPYTITFPDSNGAVEGEDFVLPNGSGIFEVIEGNSSTTVTLIESLLPNIEVTNERTLIFNLQSASGAQIGSPSDNSGTTLTVTIAPSSDD